MRRNLHSLNFSPRTVFFIALLIRVFFSSIFLGSIDTINAIGATNDYLSKNGSLPLPYFSSVPQSLILASLGSLIQIPANILIKIPGNLADAGIAWILVRHGRVSGNKKFVQAGYLYMINPLAILITSAHGQFDPIWLFLIVSAYILTLSNYEHKYRDVAVGTAMALALVTKPSSFLCLIVFFPWVVNSSSRFFRVLLGSISVAALSTFTLISIGINPYAQFRHSLTYATSGFGVFGLTKTPWQLPKEMYLIVMGVLICHVLFSTYKGKFEIPTAAALLLLAYLTIGPLAPQYMIWPIVFMFLSPLSNRFTLGLSMILFVVMLFYYKDPFASYLPYENTLTFALPNFLPIAGVSLSHSLIVNRNDFLELVLNYLLPFLFAACFLVLKSAHRQKKTPPHIRNPRSQSNDRFSVFLLVSFYLFVIFSFALNLSFLDNLYKSFQTSILKTSSFYAIDKNFGSELEWKLGWVGKISNSGLNLWIILLVPSVLFCLNSLGKVLRRLI